jgi:hypothetical protein
MPEIIETHFSFFEVEIEFTEPALKLWLDRIAIVEAVYAAMHPWNITVDDVEVITTGKPSEQGVRFKIPEKRSSFFFGAAACKFARDNTNWNTAEETISILDAALKAFSSQSQVTFKTFKTAVALHVQPKVKPFVEIMQPIIPANMAALEGEPCKTMAIILKWPTRRVTIDGSAQLANGLFIRYERDFSGDATFDIMAKQLYADEMQIFAMLDVTEQA